MKSLASPPPDCIEVVCVLGHMLKIDIGKSKVWANYQKTVFADAK